MLFLFQSSDGKDTDIVVNTEIQKLERIETACGYGRYIIGCGLTDFKAHESHSTEEKARERLKEIITAFGFAEEAEKIVSEIKFSRRD